MTDLDLDDLLSFAVNAAFHAGRMTLGHFQRGVGVERKSDNSPVTIADREAERTLRDMISTRFPNHGIIGEEYGRQPGVNGLTWVIDPIDGTQSFIHGVPLYANLLALVEDDQPLLGVINLPALGEMIYAANGIGCWWNGRRAHVSDETNFSRATVLSSAVNHFDPTGRGGAWSRLVTRTEVQRTWGDAYGYALVATGRAEIMVDPIVSVWDIAPLPVIMHEAGGHFFDWAGETTILSGNAVAVNDGLRHDLLALLAEEDQR